MSIQLIRAQIAQHKAAEFLTPALTQDEKRIAYLINPEHEDYLPSRPIVLKHQAHVKWLHELLRLQTNLTDAIQAQEKSDLE